MNSAKTHSSKKTVSFADLSAAAHSKTIQGGFRFPVGARLAGFVWRLLEVFKGGGVDGPAIQEGGAGPYVLSPGQTLVLDVNGGGDDTATFDAAAASRQTMGAQAPWNLADNTTLIITFDGRDAQTVTILAANVADIDAVTGPEICNIINSQILGGRAIWDGTRVIVKSDTVGTASRVAAITGTATPAISFPMGNGLGSGDVANIRAVTQAEVKAVVEADIAGVTVVLGDALQIKTNDLGADVTLEVKNTSTATGLGFSAGEETGTGNVAETITLDVGIDVGGKHDVMLDGAAIGEGTALGEKFGSGTNATPTQPHDLGGLLLSITAAADVDLSLLTQGEFEVEAFYFA